MFTIRTLSNTDISLLLNAIDDIFDNPIDEKLTNEFLNDPRHHIVVAVTNDQVIGFASAIHYLHPDKPAELWINEVSVALKYQNQGVAKAILKDLFELGKNLGCTAAWVLTDSNNLAANKLYKSAGGENSETVMYEFKL